MIAGIAMLTMVTSSSAMNMPTLTATRIHHLRGWPWSRVGGSRRRVGHEVVLSGSGRSGSVAMVVLPRERERTKVSSKVAGTTARSAVTPAASRAARTAGRSPPGTRSVAADERGGEAGRPERRERGVPAVGAHGDGRAVADDARERALGDHAAGGHEHQAVALARLVEVVGGDEHAGAAGGRAVDRSPRARPGRRGRRPTWARRGRAGRARAPGPRRTRGAGAARAAGRARASTRRRRGRAPAPAARSRTPGPRRRGSRPR